MRCSAWSSLAISVCSALVFAAPAEAHVTVTPPFLGAGETATLSFTGPNERDVPMMVFRVVAPPAMRILHAYPSEGWESTTTERAATWSGGTLAPSGEATFTIHVEGPTEPGSAAFDVEQRYPGGAAVRWRVPVTITPGTQSSSRGLGWILGIAALMLVVITAAGLLLLRRFRSLQER